MSKIKLSILLLVSLVLINCSGSNTLINNQNKFQMDYIGGGYDGLVLKKLLQSNLRAFNFYDINSTKVLKANIDHESKLFITNIDNTSDRERVTTTVNIEIFDRKLECNIFSFNKDLSQFYIYASNEKFLSNEKAVESIKYDNTKELVKKFINSLNKLEGSCIE